MRAADGADAAVTGIACRTSVGDDPAGVLAAVLEGRSGVREVDGPPVPEALRRAAPLEEPLLRAAIPEALESQVKFLNAAGKTAVTVGAAAAVAARLAEARLPPESVGLFLAQQDMEPAAYLGYRPAFERATEGFTKPLESEALNDATVRAMNPFHLLETLNNNAFSFLAALLAATGTNTSLSGWTSPGLDAVSLAARAVRRGDARAAVAVGAGNVSTRLSRHECFAKGLLVAGGAVAADGGAALVLESLAAARARGVRPLAVVLGHGQASPGADPAGVAGAVARALATALAEAEVRPDEPAAVVAGLTGVAESDGAVRLGVLTAAGDAPLVSFRDATGFAAVGGDVIDAALAVQAIVQGSLPAGVGEAIEVAPGAAVAVLAVGLEGQTTAVVLAGA